MKLDNFDIFYIIGIISSSVIMIILITFFFYGIPLIDYFYLIFFWTIKFLSGFGLILTITNGFFFLFKFMKERISKRTLNVFITIQLISCAILIGYGIYGIISSYYESNIPSPEFMEWVDIIVFSFGLISISLTLYLIPLFREEFQDVFEQGNFSRITGKVKIVSRNVKKKYYAFRRQYVRLQMKDHTTIKDILQIWRNKFAVYLLIPMGIGCFLFTPITFVFIVFWIKFFIFDGEPQSYERIALIISIVFIVIISILSYIFDWVFYSAISEFFWTIYIFYLIGIVVGSAIFIYHFTKLKGITLQHITDKIRDIT